MHTPVPTPRHRARRIGAPAVRILLTSLVFALVLLALPSPAGAVAVPVWTDVLPVPADVWFGNGALRISSTGVPYVSFYKDSAGTRTLVYARRVGPGSWHRQYVLTVPDLAGGATPHPGPWLELDIDDVPTIVYTRQANAGAPWSFWRARLQGAATWVHLALAFVAPPVAVDVAVDDASAVHVFALQRGTASDTLRHSRHETGGTHLCTVLVSPASNESENRWMGGVTTSADEPVAFVLNQYDAFFASGSVYGYAHDSGGAMSLEAAFRNLVEPPGPYLLTPLATVQDPFGTVAVAGGLTMVLQRGIDSWEWIAETGHPVYELGGAPGAVEDLSYVDLSPVVYSTLTFGGSGLAEPNGMFETRTVICTADFFGTWAYSFEGIVSSLAGTPSISADGRDGALITAVEDFASTRLIRFRAYDGGVTGVGSGDSPRGTALRSWPQPVRSGGELWFGGFAGDGAAEVALYDIGGRRVGSVEGMVSGGAMRVRAPHLAAGVYFARAGSQRGGRLVVAE